MGRIFQVVLHHTEGGGTIARFSCVNCPSHAFAFSYSRVGLLLSPGAVKLRSGTWTEECHRALPGPEHDVVRERLLELEQIHGATVRQRFPPEDPAVIAETLSKIPSM